MCLFTIIFHTYVLGNHSCTYHERLVRILVYLPGAQQEVLVGFVPPVQTEQIAHCGTLCKGTAVRYLFATLHKETHAGKSH